MKPLKLSRRVRIWVGALGALLAGWLSVGFGAVLTVALAEGTGRGAQSLVAVVLIAFWLSAFPIIGWIMGLICVTFWHDVPLEKRYDWSIGVVVAFFLPTLILGCGGLWLAFFLLLMMWFPLRHSLDNPPRWRQFFGLGNDYEREANEREET